MRPRYDIDAMERTARIRKLAGFKLIIAGSRHIDTDAVKKIIRSHWDDLCEVMGARPDFILSGGNPRGADRAGELVAKKLTGHRAIRFPANWDLLGKAAGPHRNLDMASVAHGLFLIWDGKSAGSAHMLSCMQVRKRPVFEIEVE